MSQLYKIKKIEQELVVKRAGDTGNIILQQDGSFFMNGCCNDVLDVGYFWRALRQSARDKVLSSYPEKGLTQANSELH